MRTIDEGDRSRAINRVDVQSSVDGLRQLPKLLWVRENEPDVWSRVRSVLLPKDYVRFRLTGDKATDVSDASGTPFKCREAKVVRRNA